MFCGYCGTELPESAGFCSNCGKATAVLMKEQSSAAENNMPEKVQQDEEETRTEEPAPAKAAAAAGKPFTARFRAGGQNRILNPLVNLRKDKKKLTMAGIIVAAAVVAVVAGRVVKENRRIGELENAIFNISSSYADEDEIAGLYEEYNALSNAAQRKVSNRETLIRAYQEVEALIAQRRQAAAQVDTLIGVIDYSNPYAEASTLKDAVTAYNSLDDSEKKYVTLFEQLSQAYDEVGSLNMAVTAENFWELFAMEFAVGTSTNYGEGTVTTQTGYNINWDMFGGSITPNYDVNTYNDYASPVYIYIAPRYPNLASECSFYINLHQTYYGLGLVDSELHEFKLQSATIEYDSSQGVGAYMIAVEDNDASKSLWNLAGMSFDFSDSFHKMNPFDASLVEISDINGSVRY